MAGLTTALVASGEAKGGFSRILDVIVAKSAEACFVEWIVGVVLAFLYVGVPVFGMATAQEVLQMVGIWPLIAALAVTRAGDTIKRAVGHVWSESDA